MIFEVRGFDREGRRWTRKYVVGSNDNPGKLPPPDEIPNEVHVAKAFQEYIDDTPDEFHIGLRVSDLIVNLATRIGYDPGTLQNMSIEFMLGWLGEDDGRK